VNQSAVIKNLSTSVHDRLLTRAHLAGRPLNEFLQNYAIERFLFRLSQSKYAQQFVLKGALLFRVWGLPANRPTRDIDMLGYTSDSVENLVSIFRDICNQKVISDGLSFESETVSGERIKERANYKGVRVRLICSLGKARMHLQIDIGFADVVFPAPVKIEYPVILRMPAPVLNVYSRESVIAEKLQAMVYLGIANSRMKDFYDLWILVNKSKVRREVLREAIFHTFKRRGTEIPHSEPMALSDFFARNKQNQWKAFISNNNLTDAPEQMAKVIASLRKNILPTLRALRMKST
jgi:predicted nucleotidyltransferase component of viral defense system